jgi:hypothetical protein
MCFKVQDYLGFKGFKEPYGAVLAEHRFMANDRAVGFHEGARDVGGNVDIFPAQSIAREVAIDDFLHGPLLSGIVPTGYVRPMGATAGSGRTEYWQ